MFKSENNTKMSSLKNTTSRCMCGRRYMQESECLEQCQGSLSEKIEYNHKTSDRTLLDLSFVQITSSILMQNDKFRYEAEADGISRVQKQNRNPGETLSGCEKLSNLEDENSYWERYQALKELEAFRSDSSAPKNLRLGLVNRMKQALDEDSKRLIGECNVFENAIQVDQVSRKIWNQAISQYTIPENILLDSSDNTSYGPRIDAGFQSDQNNIGKAVQMFQREITLLEEAYQQCEQESAQLGSLQTEQYLRRKQLDKLYDSVAETQIAVELEARAFDNDHEQLCRMLAISQEELDCISSASIRLPTILLQLQVDERGLRYPLINELRLAYRPKGDVHWEEIQGAWALAAQLLLFSGNLFGFHSQHCKIVPLSSCAKLIYHPPNESSDVPQSSGHEKRSIVYNLGHPQSNTKKALLTWNALMCQIIHFVYKKMQQVENEVDGECVVPSIPFAVSSTTVGNITLTKLDENDDVGWSKAIQYMASNLRWLSECASIFVNNTVVATS